MNGESSLDGDTGRNPLSKLPGNRLGNSVLSSTRSTENNPGRNHQDNRETNAGSNGEGNTGNDRRRSLTCN